MAKCKALMGSAVKGLIVIYHLIFAAAAAVEPSVQYSVHFVSS